MSDIIRSAVVPSYVLLCIVLGGSTQGVYTNLALQIVGLGVIVWAVLARQPGRLPSPSRALFVLAGLVGILFVLQLIPLPPSLWSALGGRQDIADGYRLLGQPLPWLPLSLAPFETLATPLTLIPPLAVLSAMLLPGAFRPAWIAAAVLLGTVAAVLLGALQVGSSDPLNSPWYLYPQSNFGFATGFFSNSNNMGALLVISLPLLLALVRHLRERAHNTRSGSIALMLALAGVLVLAVGVVLNGSLAVLLLGLPALAVSVTMLNTRRPSGRRAALITGAVSLAALLALLLSPIGERLVGGNSTSLDSRVAMWSTTLRGIAEFAPFGSGIGTFPDVYATYEDPAAVTATVVNHAHNDYLEIALEAGLPGVLLLALFFLWWIPRARMMWRPHAADAFGQAAVIASGVLLLHSLVEFPLRMPALNAIMAACLGFMAMPRRAGAGEAEDLWPTRHLTI